MDDMVFVKIVTCWGNQELREIMQSDSNTLWCNWHYSVIKGDKDKTKSHNILLSKLWIYAQKIVNGFLSRYIICFSFQQ